MGYVRTSVDRWTTLSTLLLAMERAVEGAARLDAYDQHPARAHLLSFGERMHRLEARLDRELDRLTAELLDAQLTKKKHQSAA